MTGGDLKIERLCKFWRLLKTDLYRAFISFGFLLGAVVSAAILFYGSLQDSSSNAVIRFLNSFVWGNVIDLFFLADSLAYSACFASEWQSGFYRPIIARSNPRAYALSKCISTAIASGASVMVGVAAFIAYICINCAEIVPEANVIYGEVPIFYEFLYADLPFCFFSAYLFIVFMQAAFFGVLGLCVSGYFPNKYVAYVSPYVFSFVVNQTANALKLPNNFDPVKMAMGRLFGASAAVVIGWIFIYFTLLTLLCSALFIRRVKRSVANA